MVSTSANSNPIDFTFRVIESIAFCLHAVLGLTEPWTGCLRRAFQDNGAMPSWFWPVAGAILFLVAFANFSSSNVIVLITQAYIASFHMGAVLYHQQLGHHPAVGCAPAIFVIFAFIVIVIRTNNNLWITLLVMCACALIANSLCNVLVHPPPKQNLPSHDDDFVHIHNIDDDDDLSPEERARRYISIGNTN